MNKIYIVTSGCYSDYYIDRVFSTREKAEEYVEWCGYDDAHIETYIIDDTNTEDKYYNIRTNLILTNGQGYIQPYVTQSVLKELKGYNSLYIDEFEYEDSGIIDITLNRFVRAENYNSEFHLPKCEKSAYDYLAIVKQKLNEGFSIEEINDLFDKDIDFIETEEERNGLQ